MSEISFNLSLKNSNSSSVGTIDFTSKDINYFLFKNNEFLIRKFYYFIN